MGALNGIFVNGRKVDVHILQDQDLVQFGGICNAPLGTVLKGSNLCVQYVFNCSNSNKNKDMEVPNGDFMSPHKTPHTNSAQTPLTGPPGTEVQTVKVSYSCYCHELNH